MAKVDLELIQKLRERTGIGMLDCKKALAETDGDIEKAIIVLRKKGTKIAEKRSSHATDQGLIHAYIHPGSKVGVMIQINCETDFVARTKDLKIFANDICMHIAACNPKYVCPEDVDKEFIDKERTLYVSEMVKENKPANVIDQIVDGKIKKLYSQICLLQQPFVKNDQMTVEDVLKELIAKLGENIKIAKFARFEI